MYKNNLFPIDLQDERSSQNAWPAALELAGTAGESLHVITVVLQINAFTALIGPKEYERLVRTVINGAKQSLREKRPFATLAAENGLLSENQVLKTLYESARYQSAAAPATSD